MTAHTDRIASPTAEIRMHSGAPTLFIDGQPQASLVYTAGSRNNRTNRYDRQFGEAGIHLHSFYACPGGVGESYDVSAPCWVAPERFDYGELDRRMASILEADPQAYVLPRLYLNSPHWWDELHPEELVTYDPGDGQPIPYWLRPDKRAPCWASRIWREDMAQALRRFIEHVRGSGYAGRVISYHLTSGNTEEWFYWGSNQDQWADYSAPHRQAFQEWLQLKYHTAEELAQAWGQPGAQFGDVAIPLKRERQATQLGVLRDPARERQVVDYYLFHSDLVAETIAYFARVAKEATERRAIVGVFYGYVMQLGGEVNLDGVDDPVACRQRQQNAGHLSLRKVWGCPDVDFLTCPTSYEFRWSGRGYSHFSSPIASLQHHGKLWLDENDLQTWLSTPNSFPGAYGRPQSYQETLQQQRREFVTVIAQRTGMWWFDMGQGGWYDHPDLLREFGQMQRIAENSLTWDRASVAEVALVVDDHSLAHMQVGNELSPTLLLAQLPELGRAGAPYDVYALDDLARARPYQVYLFVNAFKLEEEHRRAIEALKADGHTLVWLYAPGFLQEHGTEAAAMERVTGIRVRYTEGAKPLRVHLVDGDPLLDGMAASLAGASFGTATPISPVFFAEDPAATVLARFDDGRAGLVVKRLADWVSIYSAAPAMPSWLLRRIYAAAGVHLYVESDDVLYANRSLLGISVNKGGQRHIRLPVPSDVHDLFSGQRLAQGVRELRLDLAPGSTRLLRLVPA